MKVWSSRLERRATVPGFLASCRIRRSAGSGRFGSTASVRRRRWGSRGTGTGGTRSLLCGSEQARRGRGPSPTASVFFFFFPAAPPVPPATLGLGPCLAGSKGLRAAVPRSPAGEALASWVRVWDVGALPGGTGFGGMEASPHRWGLMGTGAVGIPFFAFRLVSGTEDSLSPGLRPARSWGWRKMDGTALVPPRCGGKGVRRLRPSLLLAGFGGEGSSRWFSKGHPLFQLSFSSRKGREKEPPGSSLVWKVRRCSLFK